MTHRMRLKTYRTRATKGKQNREISQMVPEFSFDIFIRLPNAAQFVEKLFDQCLTQMMKEIDENNRNGTTVDHLASMETVIARMLQFTSEDIRHWCGTRDWKGAGIIPKQSEKITSILVEFGVGKSGVNAELSYDKATREKLAQRIWEVADKQDPIADWLFTRLTTERVEPTPLAELI